MAEPLDIAVAELQKKLQVQEETVVRTKTMINDLCEMMGKPPIYTDAQLSTSKITAVRSDTYYGQAMQTAIRDVLARRASVGPATAREIYDSLLAGGYDGFRTGDEQNRLTALRISLRKNSKIFHKLPGGEWGLVEWYPKIRKKGSAEDADDDGDDDDGEPERDAQRPVGRGTENADD
jgi:hypothetical protein